MLRALTCQKNAPLGWSYLRLRDTCVKGLKLQQQQLQAGEPPMSDMELANTLKITIQRWQEACRSQHTERIMPISAIHEQPSSPGNDDPQQR